MADPGRAQHDGIIAVPTLVRRWSGAVTRIIGDLSNSECVLTRLNIEAGIVRGESGRPADPNPAKARRAAKT
jgi:hypothetical protein